MTISQVSGLVLSLPRAELSNTFEESGDRQDPSASTAIIQDAHFAVCRRALS